MKLLAIATALALTSPAWAINKCTGADGKLTFQDSPCPLGSATARDDLADAKKASEKNTNAPVQSAKMAADNLQSQLEAELKKHPVTPRTVQPSGASAVSSSSTAMPFHQCNLSVEAVISSLGVGWKDVKRIVNSANMSMTKICTSDGSVTITCSGPDSKMVTTQGSRC